MVAVSSWGRLSRSQHHIKSISTRTQAYQDITTTQPGITFGLGRSYGDVCLNPGGTLWTTERLDNFISFDETQGRIICEAGVSLQDIQRLVVPRGWMLPVTPGTQFVTIGGAIANDVHGKNHHRFGTFGEHVAQFTLLRTDGQLLFCGPDENTDWLRATIGGLGLTGIILSAEIQLRPVSGPWLSTETIPYESLDEFFQLADESEADWEYTVSWIDCLSRQNRGLFMRANHTSVESGGTIAEKSRSVPITPPISLVNSFTLRLLNLGYFNLGKKQTGSKIVHYEPFFYPLDKILEWNRIYGPKGFYQYQCVVPRADGLEAIRHMLDIIAHSGNGSFLSVLKTFGVRQSPGMLSFPQSGVTLALDFPNRGTNTELLFSRLDSIVAEAGGRIYPAKDARMPKILFEQGYPSLNEFLPYRDPGISSAMSRRLIGS